MPTKAQLFFHALDNLQIYRNGILQVWEKLTPIELVDLYEWWRKKNPDFYSPTKEIK